MPYGKLISFAGKNNTFHSQSTLWLSKLLHGHLLIGLLENLVKILVGFVLPSRQRFKKAKRIVLGSLNKVQKLEPTTLSSYSHGKICSPIALYQLRVSGNLPSTGVHFTISSSAKWGKQQYLPTVLSELNEIIINVKHLAHCLT